ncbi:MAG: tRNA 2-thiocytidine(32) synthetase TtcA [Ruminococcaceae bacterium]|nr:tRNA 2-thiocytidine(32) synthetase TtcA [Oscillospiraceae bacterium]
MQHMLSYLRRAVDDYQMIAPGDKIAVGVSGGKDSIMLLAALKALARFYPNPFTLQAITIDMGFENADFSAITAFCESIEVPHTVVKTDIAPIIFDIRKETNPCALCAKMRKGALNEAALSLGCKKVALGHHNEDVIETFFLSLFYEGRMHCFSPVTYLDRTGVTLIRPLIYAPESLVRSTVKRLELPIQKNPCPADGNTKRQEAKEMVNEWEHKDRGFKERIFTAIQRSGMDGWTKTKGEK